MIIFIISSMIIAAATLVAAFIIYRQNNIRKTKISFKEALDLTDLPIITLTNNNKKFNFLLDTGSTHCHINKKLVDYNIIKSSPIETKTNVFGMEGVSRQTDMVDIKLSIRNNDFEDSFIVNDLEAAFDSIKRESGVTLHGILGTSLFDKYRYIIDFNKYIAYSK